MIPRSGSIELDAGRRELRCDGASVAVEPRVLSLLRYLAENGGRVVARDELIRHVWRGRTVGDAAVSTCVKAARRAVGDSGERQSIIRTVRGRGFRFVPSVQAARRHVVSDIPPHEAATAHPEPRTRFAGRPSIAVLRFEASGTDAGAHPLIVAIPAELISALSRLRWLFVTARGSSFRLHPHDASPRTVRSLLRVGYRLTGLIEVVGSRISGGPGPGDAPVRRVRATRRAFRVPLVARDVFPVPAESAADAVERGHGFDPHHELRLLVAEPALDAQVQRRAVTDRQIVPVHAVG